MKGSKLIKKDAPYYIALSNAYAHLEEFSADPDPTNEVSNDCTKIGEAKQPSKFKSIAATRRQTRKQQYISDMKEDGLIDMYIVKAEDERTSLAKMSPRNKNHSDKANVKPSLLERGLGLGQTVATAARRLLQQVKKCGRKRVRFDGSCLCKHSAPATKR